MSSFATKMQKYLGKPFRPGATGPDAYDCVGFVYRYLKDEGAEIPDTFQDWTLQDYFVLAETPRLEMAKLQEWARTLGEEIPVSKVLAGDIIVSEANGIVFLSIYGGNNHAVSVARHLGVRVHKIDHKHIRPVMAIRWRHG